MTIFHKQVEPSENRPVGLFLCAEKGMAEEHYDFDSLPNRVIATEHKIVPPDEKLIGDGLRKPKERTRIGNTNFQRLNRTNPRRSRWRKL